MTGSVVARRERDRSGPRTPRDLHELGHPTVDVAVLAVKPAEIEAVLRALPPAALYLSIAAGRSIGDIAAVVGGGRAIVRAMPNLPAAIGQGVTGLCAGQGVSAADRATAASLMAAVAAFREAAELRPDWPDPFLGLMRTFVYGLEDVERGADALKQAQRHGHTPNEREIAQVGDGYRLRGNALVRNAREHGYGAR